MLGKDQLRHFAFVGSRWNILCERLTRVRALQRVPTPNAPPARFAISTLLSQARRRRQLGSGVESRNLTPAGFQASAGLRLFHPGQPGAVRCRPPVGFSAVSYPGVAVPAFRRGSARGPDVRRPRGEFLRFDAAALEDAAVDVAVRLGRAASLRLAPRFRPDRQRASPKRPRESRKPRRRRSPQPKPRKRAEV